MNNEVIEYIDAEPDVVVNKEVITYEQMKEEFIQHTLMRNPELNDYFIKKWNLERKKYFTTPWETEKDKIEQQESYEKIKELLRSFREDI